MEEESIRRGEARVKFKLKRIDEHEEISECNWQPLAKALTISEELGAAPICPVTGQLFGNGAMIYETSKELENPNINNNDDDNNNDDCIIVSKSGRIAGTKYDSSQFVKVISFDKSTWTATYDSKCTESKPSSDTPLLYNALLIAPKLYKWKSQPKFVLHGHTCSSEEEANALNIPCSSDETLFSTPEDLNSLMKLFNDYPYPTYQIHVRKNHGFFLLSETAEEAIELFRTKLSKVIVHDKLLKVKNNNDNGANNKNDENNNNSISAKCALENDSKLIKTKHDNDETGKLSPRKKLKKMDEKKDAD